MKSLQENILSLFGIRRTEDIFFKVNPGLIGSVTEVRMEKVRCKCCKEDSLDAWVYKLGEDWLQDNVWDICLECQKDAYSTHMTRQMRSKHQDVVDGDWYFISESDQSGFKNFDESNPTTTAAKEKTFEYTKVLLSGEIRNMRISGTTGTGKTHLAKAIARTMKSKGKRVAFIEAVKLFDKIKGTFGNDHERKRLEEHFAGFDLVVIDDVGVETKKIADVSWTSSEWPRLIELRKGKSTVYTTNFDEKALAGVIGARAESRMSENAVKVEIFTPGKDHRKDQLFY